jgi:hypothetical protein
MQKKKNNFIGDLFNESNQIDDDLENINNEMFYAGAEESVLATFPIIMSSTFGLTKLIIENKVRNSEKLTDRDIYKIHSEAFNHVSNIFLVEK